MAGADPSQASPRGSVPESPEGSAAEVELSVVEIACPRCETLCMFPVDRMVVFPGDASAILDLTGGKLNVRACAVCRLVIDLDVALLVADLEHERVAAVGFDDATVAALCEGLSELGLDSVEVLRHSTKEELRVTVGSWVEAWLADALAPVLGGTRPERDVDGVAAYQRPLVLLTLQRLAAGDAQIALRTEPPMESEKQLDLVRGLRVGFTVELIDGLFTHAFHHEGIATVLEAVEAQVPIECIDDRVLSVLVDRCIDQSDDLWGDPARLDKAFRYEYLCAVAHAAAERRSPRRADWASLLLLIFALSRSPNVVVPDAMLLEAGVLRRTIDFGDAWNVAHLTFSELDQEQREHVEAWFDHIGWGARFRAEWASVPMQVDPGMFTKLPDEELVSRVTATIAVAAREDVEMVSGMIATMLMRAGRGRSALLIIEAALDELAAAEEWEQVGSLSIRGAAVMNQYLDYVSAQSIVSRYFDQLLNEDIPCQLRYSLVNELGNVLRYQGSANHALELYDEVANLMHECEDARQVDFAILRRNRAIVLRERGSFDRAIELLEAALEEDDPENVEGRIDSLVSLTRTYVDAGMPERALPNAEQAAAIALSPSHGAQRIKVLLALAAARAAALPGAEIPELDEALALAEQLPRMREIVSAATLRYASTSAIDERLIAKAQAILGDKLRHADFADPPFVLVTAAYSLAEWELGRGDGARAEAILSDLYRWVERDRVPWQISYLEARLPRTSVAEAWMLMHTVLGRLDSGVPAEAGVPFVTSYMADKTDVQRFMLATLRSALQEGHADATDCLPVFEFLNGREMRGAPTERDLVDDASGSADPVALLERLRQATDTQSTLFLLFLEHESEVQLVWVRSETGECGIEPFAIDAKTLRSISAGFSKRTGAVCLTDAQMQAAADVVEPVLIALGEVIATRAAPGQHVCVLPSPAILGLPVHAACGVDGAPLLERNSISLAPNLAVVCRVLEDRRTGRPEGEEAIVIVCKQGDHEQFIDRAQAAAVHIEGSLSSSPSKSVGLDASKDAVLSTIASCEHFVFIGHGARALHAHGRCLCVASGDALPTASLPVDVAPELRRFMIDAGDLELLPRTPAFVSSIACSSGRSFAGSGGARLGLERALFAGGTKTILAPLWDVNEPSALSFLETFYGLWSEEPQMSVAETHRRTSLSMQRRYGHLFLWAPFALNGDWT